MAASNKDALIAKLKLAHQSFLASNLARKLQEETLPIIDLEGLKEEMRNVDTPLSVVVREGRD